MKFGKRLRDLLEDSLPEWQDKFLAYKELKKKLKSLPSGDSPARGTGELEGDSGRVEGPTEELFVKLLNTELEKFNDFFMEKEEEFVIRMQVVREQIERLKAKCQDGDLIHCTNCVDELNEVRKTVVGLHGEMVLLENYSNLNYTGLVKILKKHDKRTGLLLRHPYISNVLRQPFLTTEILGKLVKECEQRMQTMFPAYSSAGSQVDDRSGAASCLEEGREGPEGGDRESSPGSPESQSRGAAGCALGLGGARLPGEGGALGEGGPGPDDDVEVVYRSALRALQSLQEIRGSSKTPHPLLAEAGFAHVSFQNQKQPRDSESGAGEGGERRGGAREGEVGGEKEGGALGLAKGVPSASSTPGNSSLGGDKGGEKGAVQAEGKAQGEGKEEEARGGERRDVHNACEKAGSGDGAGEAKEAREEKGSAEKPVEVPGARTEAQEGKGKAEKGERERAPEEEERGNEKRQKVGCSGSKATGGCC